MSVLVSGDSAGKGFYIQQPNPKINYQSDNVIKALETTTFDKVEASEFEDGDTRYEGRRHIDYKKHKHIFRTKTSIFF